ncbi:hypothetical protein EI94DRAFT_1782365 [Lactarius quietus]|nr:hypothetical protein EI94DRAFT_1782365 [Lactarius quietus]
MSAPVNDGVNGTVCNAQQYNQSMFTTTITCLTPGQSIGLALTAEASFISLTAVIVVLILIGRNVLRHRRVLPKGDWTLFQEPADIYMFSLFLYDILQAMGGILDVRWAHNGIVRTGSYCTAQGIIQQMGELGVALITLSLTIQTFVVALWKVGIRARDIACCAVILATVFIVLWVGLGNDIHKHYETPTPYWCWIGARFNRERLAGEYIWLWITLLASVVTYIPLYFWTNGRLSIDPKKWYKFQLIESKEGYQQRRAALGMLLLPSYPLAYSLMVLPLSITRWLQFKNKHKHVASAATFFSVSVFNLSGAINVLLFLIVRPRLLLFFPPEENSELDAAGLGQPATGSALFPNTPNDNQSPQPTGMGLADDGEWEPSLGGNSIALSPIESSPRSDNI